MMKIPIRTILSILLTMIVASPSDGVSLIYAEQGQSQEQQNRDIRECNLRARQQTGLDPTRPLPKDEANSQASRQRRQQQLQAYNQVLATCLKERGYRVE
jgi:hypothetical protein